MLNTEMTTVLLPELEKSDKFSRREAKEIEGRLRIVTETGTKYYVSKKVEYLCTCPDYIYRQKECKHIRKVKPFM
jgi:predicted nucleic acid-binding Zn finger protein